VAAGTQGECRFGPVIEPRIYRAAFLPTLLAVVVAMFSLESRPAPLPQGLAADILFDGEAAAETMRDIAERNPDRRPGSLGNAAVADLVARELAGRGFDPVVRRRFTAEGARLENVIARKPGAVRDQVVLAAARDTADEGPDAVGTAADTAALLELARIFEGRASNATIVLASIDGSSLGDAGARHLYETVRQQGPVRAIIVLSNLAASTSRGPLVVQWSNDATRGSIGLQRTAVASLREELGGLPGDESWAGQLARLAFPLAIGAQGVLNEAGATAVRISGSGELPPPPERRDVEDANVERFADLGRGVLRLATALDGKRGPEHGPSSYIIGVRNVMPGWAITLLAAALLLPPLVASVDAAARARRRRARLAGWWAWTLLAAVPPLIGLLLAEFLVLVGQAPQAPSAPPVPSDFPFGGGAALTLALVAAAVVLSWLLVRPELIRRAGAIASADSPGAGAATALALSLAGVVVLVLNPFAALVLVPAIHLWMLAMVADTRPGVTAALVAGGLLGPGLVAVYYLARLDLGPLEGAWYLFLLVTGGHVGVVGTLVGVLLLALLAAVVAVAAARIRAAQAPPRPSGPRIRGPASYAGPGSLGGTESALRR